MRSTVSRSDELHPAVFADAVQWLGQATNAEEKRDILRLAQQALGDFGRGGPYPAVWNGYANTLRPSRIFRVLGRDIGRRVSAWPTGSGSRAVTASGFAVGR